MLSIASYKHPRFGSFECLTTLPVSRTPALNVILSAELCTTQFEDAILAGRRKKAWPPRKQVRGGYRCRVLRDLIPVNLSRVGGEK
jgi:hypothetical protein